MVRFALVLLCVGFAINGSAAAQETSPADFDGDGEVNFSDFLIFAGGFGRTGHDADFDARLDLNDSGAVDFQDFLLFAGQFGGSTPPEDVDREPFDPPRIYVVDTWADRVFVVDAESNFYNPGLSVAVSQPRSVAYSYLNRRFYVAGIDSFFALAENSEIDFRLPLLDPPESSDSRGSARGGFRMALSPDHRFAYVTEDVARQVEVIDLKFAESVALIPLSFQPGGIATSPDGGTVYVGHSKHPWISVIDGPGRSLADSIRLDGWGNGRVAVSSSGERVFTSTTLGGDDPLVQIVAIDPATKEVVDALEVARDSTTLVYDIQTSRDRRKLYATVRRQFLDANHPMGIVFVGYFWTMDAATLEKTGEIRIEAQAVNFGVSRDDKTAYVAVLDLLSGSYGLKILDLESHSVLGDVPVTFLTPFRVRVYGGKAALGRILFPEITVF